jgi:hypothetical protein
MLKDSLTNVTVSLLSDQSIPFPLHLPPSLCLLPFVSEGGFNNSEPSPKLNTDFRGNFREFLGFIEFLSGNGKFLHQDFLSFPP